MIAQAVEPATLTDTARYWQGWNEADAMNEADRYQTYRQFFRTRTDDFARGFRDRTLHEHEGARHA